MRPLRLKLENFTCFGHGPVEVDFTSLELFAITGRTGAGKSSLLDAMIFALYGSVPRIGAKGLSELISLGRERMTVVLDFSVGNRSFRATRIVRRAATSEARLDELTGEQARPLTSGGRETACEIVRLLGVPYDTFIQAVVLPQGQFATFLKSAPGQRRAILRELLHLQVYETMRTLVSRRRDDLDLHSKLLERQLAQDFAGVTPEALEALHSEEKLLAGQVQELTADLESAERQLAELRSRHEKTQELEQRQSLVAQLGAQEPRIRLLTARIDQARRATPLLPLVEAANQASFRCSQADHCAVTARRQRDLLQGSERQLRTQLRRTQRRAKALPELRKRIAGLDQVLGRLKSRDALHQRLDQATAGARRLKSELYQAKARERRAVQMVRQCGGALVKANRRLERIGYDAELDRKLSAVRDRANLLAAVREAAAATAKDAQQAAQKAALGRTAAGRANAADQRAQKRLEKACERATALQSALDQVRRSHATAILRRQLRSGIPCPVCEGSVVQLPALIEPPDLHQAEENLVQARHEETHVRGVADHRREAAARADAAAQEAQRAVRKNAIQLEQARAKLVRAEGELDAEIAGLVANDSGATIERRVLTATKRIVELKRGHDCAARECELARQKIVEAEHAVKQASAAIRRVVDLWAQAEIEVDGLKADRKQIDAEITTITTARDPQAKRECLGAVCVDLERALVTITKEHTAAEKDLSAAEAIAHQSTRAVAQAALDWKRAHRKARRAAMKAGFADEKLAAQAVLSKAETARTEREINHRRREAEVNTMRVAELLGQLGEGGVSAQSLRNEERAFSERKGAYDRARSEQARRDEQIMALAQRLERARALHEELDSCRCSHGLYAQLADELRSDHFQAFVLRDTFCELVRGASERLWNLSARYRLHWEDESFDVVDYDNGRQLRPAETLSGGRDVHDRACACP